MPTAVEAPRSVRGGLAAALLEREFEVFFQSFMADQVASDLIHYAE